MEVLPILSIIVITLLIVLLVHRVKEGCWPWSRDDASGPGTGSNGGSTRPDADQK